MKYVLLVFFLLVGCKDPGVLLPHTNQDLAKVKMGYSFDKTTEICGFPDKYYAFTEGSNDYQVLLFRIEGELPYDFQNPNSKTIVKGIEENIEFDFLDRKLVAPNVTIEMKYTPVLVRNDKVIGIGWRSFKANGIDLSSIKEELESL